MNFRLKSVKSIIYKTVRDLGIGDREIPWQDFIEYCAEALQQIDGYTQYIERLGVEIEIEDNIAKLPLDFYSAIANPHLVYKIQGDSIVTEKANGVICFNYLAFPLDEEGFPLVPDNVAYDEALMWKIATKLAMRGDLVSTAMDLRYCEAKWNFYCKQARSVSNMLSADDTERFAQNRLRFKPDSRQYNVEFWRVKNPIDRKRR
jgi:hypothetical protein